MNKYILIVEDDEAIAKNLMLLLTEEGYGVSLAKNGRLALDYLQGTAVLPKLILLDLMMPVMDGFQFRAEQEKDPKLGSIPVIILTADGQIEAKRQRANAQAFIRKPIDIEHFLATVEKNIA